MKRQVVIELIQEFIVEKPKRPYQEVEEYASNLHSTYDELQEAILGIPELIQHKNTDKSKSRQDGKKIKIPHLIINANFLLPVKIGIILAVAIFIVTITYTATNPLANKKMQQSNSVLSSKTKQEQPIPKDLSLPRVIYANEKTLNPQKIFSYPASKITLKFTGTPKQEVFGFFPYWILPAQEDISLEGFTTISLFALETDGKGNIITASSNNSPSPGWAMWTDKSLDNLIKKAREKRIKIFLTIESFNNKNIEEISTSNDVQKRFIANAIQLVNSKSLDGINIDFEYKGKASDNVISGFVRLVANINSELKRQIPNSQLSIDTYLSSAATRDFFDVQLLKDYVDTFVVMGYDIHNPSGESGPISPLEGENGILGYIQSYLERVSPDKLILALPYYGYDWPIIKNPANINNAQILSYAEISALSNSYKILWDDTSQSPYYRYTDTQTGISHEVYFENTRSLGLKYDYIKNKNLKGVGVWAIGYDGYNQELQQLLLEKFAD